MQLSKNFTLESQTLDEINNNDDNYNDDNENNNKKENIKNKVKSLSGGNQQKVLLAKWLHIEPQILILDEPTRGVDVGAKAEIDRIIEDLKSQGKAILLISSEFSEIMGLSDRIVVIQRGKVAGEFTREEAAKDTRILEALADGGGDTNVKY